MKCHLKALIVILIVLGSFRAESAELGIHFGPASLGSGGSNPLSIPPSGADIGFSYLNDNKTDFRLSLVGIGYGKRIEFKSSGYMSLGGAIPFSINGIGLGVYSIFGWRLFELDSGISGNIEYLQMIGLSSSGIVSPHSIRIGVDTSW